MQTKTKMYEVPQVFVEALEPITVIAASYFGSETNDYNERDDYELS